MHSNVYMYEYICNIHTSEPVLRAGGIYFIQKKSTAYSIHEFDSLINDH